MKIFGNRNSNAASTKMCLLPASIMALLGFSLTSVASSLTVSNCNDHGAGSLREAVGATTTLSGDTIDLSGLSSGVNACSQISLNTGAITINQQSLTLSGPGRGSLLISSAGDRVLIHAGTGTLSLANVSIAYGEPTSSTSALVGGCIYSKGTVDLNNVDVFKCELFGTANQNVFGGGIFAKGLTMESSTLNQNFMEGSRAADGGAAVIDGTLIIRNSTISGNEAFTSNGGAQGGGIQFFAGGYSSNEISNSTFSENEAHGSSGGINTVGGAFVVLSASGLPATMTITNSTISRNTSTGIVGGAQLYDSNVIVQNSTVALNIAGYGRNGSGTYSAAGLDIQGFNSFPMLTATLQSTLMAENSYADGSALSNNDLSSSVTISGNNNLIVAATVTVPSDTITGKCPLIGPLRNNGGSTQTHALLSHSPAIDAGNNAAQLGDDQRGPPYVRVSGPAPDIGAYEVQKADIIFNASFDGCA